MTSADELVLSQAEWQALSGKLRTAMAMGCSKSHSRTWWPRRTEVRDSRVDQQAASDSTVAALREFLCQSGPGFARTVVLQNSGFSPAQIEAATFLSNAISGR